jgi:hypothetical protein
MITNHEDEKSAFQRNRGETFGNSTSWTSHKTALDDRNPLLARSILREHMLTKSSRAHWTPCPQSMLRSAEAPEFLDITSSLPNLWSETCWPSSAIPSSDNSATYKIYVAIEHSSSVDRIHLLCRLVTTTRSVRLIVFSYVVLFLVTKVARWSARSGSGNATIFISETQLLILELKKSLNAKIVQTGCCQSVRVLGNCLRNLLMANSSGIWWMYSWMPVMIGA